MRSTFICKMALFMILILTVAILLHTNYYSQLIIWALFSYIIGKEMYDYWYAQNRPRRDARLRREIYEKLRKIIRDVKSTV